MKQNLYITIILLLFLPFQLLAESGFDHYHTQWEQVLSKHLVVTGKQSSVKYKELQESPEQLRNYLKAVSAVSKDEYDSFSKSDRLAFLINAYNAFTLELIIEHYPVDSIKDIGGIFTSPWKKDFFTLFGEKHTLDDIEHEMIRKWFDEPRIHFALVCAAISCPPLRKDPFIGSTLEGQLEAAAKNFLSDPERNRLDGDTLELSSIFKWFGDDFKPRHGSVKEYVAPFFKVEADKVDIDYLSYDWSLNNAQ